MLDIIGITGRAGSGKDTVGQFLVERYGFERIAFADPLKRIAREIGWDGGKEDAGNCAHCGMLQGRTLLQVLGTEGLRQHLGKNVWIDALLRHIVTTRALTGQSRWVITDVRYTNEADMIQAHDGHVWRVVRPELRSNDAHDSETALADIMADVTFTNDGTVDALHRLVEEYAEQAGWHEGAILLAR